MNALDLLRADHEKVKDMMRRLEGTERDEVETREQLFGDLVQELTVHEKVEEEIFYPALKQSPQALEDVLAAFEQHHLVDEIVNGIEDTPYDAAEWAPKFKVLRENVEDHIAEEERTLFGHAREAFGSAELDDIGTKMQQLKNEEVAELEGEEA